MKQFLFLIISLIFNITLNAQIEIKASGGSFESLTPWQDGYLGVVQTQAYAVAPKYRQYQYFSKDGKMMWNKKITPFNFNNASICHSESPFAYFVNMPFYKTAMFEKSSKTEFLNLYQVDRLGNVKEKAITYSGPLKSLSGSAKKIIPCYIGAFKDGIIIVGNTDDVKYHVVKVDHEFNVSYQEVNFDWDEKLWVKNGISQVKFAMGDNEISLIQTKHVGYKLVTTIKTIDLNTFADVNVVTNNIDLSGYRLNSKSGAEIDYLTTEQVFTSYERSMWKGDYHYILPTLGSFINFKYTDEGLKMYTYYKYIKSGTKREVDREGYLLYDINNIEDADISPAVDFKFDSDKSGSISHAFHISNDGVFFFIIQQSKSNIIIESSNVKKAKFDGELSLAEAYLSFVTGDFFNKSNEIDLIYFVGDTYIGIDFVGFKNSFGNTSNAIIYRY